MAISAKITFHNKWETGEQQKRVGEETYKAKDSSLDLGPDIQRDMDGISILHVGHLGSVSRTVYALQRR